METRNTVQRSIILDAVKALKNHATADEIYAHIAAEHPSISKATVYRNLKLLSQLGEIRKVELSDGADRYDHLCHNHYHAQCTKCGRVFDIELTFIEDLEKRIKDTRGFVFQRHDIMFKGICSECSKLQSNERVDET
ncbi:MAG: transcriptional repressor [Firmicutes bacterium]|nr:transcriptional repressor [Bacillota bacterium]